MNLIWICEAHKPNEPQLWHVSECIHGKNIYNWIVNNLENVVDGIQGWIFLRLLFTIFQSKLVLQHLVLWHSINGPVNTVCHIGWTINFSSLSNFHWSKGYVKALDFISIVECKFVIGICTLEFCSIREPCSVINGSEVTWEALLFEGATIKHI